MKYFKDYWMWVIVLFLFIFSILVYMDKNKGFCIDADGGLLEWSYRIKIPKKYVNKKYIEQHHSALFKIIESNE